MKRDTGRRYVNVVYDSVNVSRLAEPISRCRLLVAFLGFLKWRGLGVSARSRSEVPGKGLEAKPPQNGGRERWTVLLM